MTNPYDDIIRLTAFLIWQERGGDPRFNTPPTLNEILHERERIQKEQLALAQLEKVIPNRNR